VLQPELGFGGVGGSGFGRFGGELGFRSFSNAKNVVEKHPMNFWPVTQIITPWTQSRQNIVAFLFKFLGFGQFRIMFTILRLAMMWLVLNLIFGQLGESPFRQQAFSGLIKVL